MFPQALSIAKLILNRLETYNTDKTDIANDLKMPECLKFLPEEKLHTNKKYQLFGIISTQSISLEHCSLQTDG